jgi:uncharacterized membrane protein YfcA
VLLPEALFLVLLGSVASFFGSMLGIGGGVFIVPMLTVFFGVPIHDAIGASLVSVIATSTVTGSTKVRSRLTNVRLAMVLEVATTIGAFLGAIVSLQLDLRVLAAILFVVLVASAVHMFRRRHDEAPGVMKDAGAADNRKGRGMSHRVRSNLNLSDSYYDEALKREVEYGVARAPYGFGLSMFAGAVSGLLGIGGGIIKVPAMTGLMRVPIKVASATSNLMIGVTACASASVFYAHGSIDAPLTACLLLGVVSGSFIGTRLVGRTPTAHLRILFSAVLVFSGVLMLLKAFGVTP